MEEPKDKRTTKYKQWKELQSEVITETVGLGDVVESITKAIGIKKVVDVVSKKLDKDCGCDKRKEFLNKLRLFKNKKVLRCLTDNQRGQYINFIDTRKKGKWERNEMQLMFDLYAHAFAIQYQIKSFGGNCQGCAKILQEIQDKLDKVYYDTE